jgi:hypothetical protein
MTSGEVRFFRWKAAAINTAPVSDPVSSQVRRRTRKSVTGLHRK